MLPRSPRQPPACVTVLLPRPPRQFDLEATATVAQVKELLFDETGVMPDKQKLLGLPKGADDATVFESIPPGKPTGYALILMGSTQAQLDSVAETEEMLALRCAPLCPRTRGLVWLTRVSWTSAVCCYIYAAL